MIAACVMALEARDNAAKIVPGTAPHIESPRWPRITSGLDGLRL
jgi:hypothetical protein